jgi:hypothetical protein
MTNLSRLLTDFSAEMSEDGAPVNTEVSRPPLEIQMDISVGSNKDSAQIVPALPQLPSRCGLPAPALFNPGHDDGAPF